MTTVVVGRDVEACGEAEARAGETGVIRAHLVLEWFDGDGEIKDIKHTAPVDLVCLPRIGERLHLDDKTWTVVTDILHTPKWTEGNQDFGDSPPTYPLPFVQIIMRVDPPSPYVFPE